MEVVYRGEVTYLDRQVLDDFGRHCNLSTLAHGPLIELQEDLLNPISYPLFFRCFLGLSFCLAAFLDHEVAIFDLKVGREHSHVLQLEKDIFYLGIGCSINFVFLIVDHEPDSLAEKGFLYELAGVNEQL